jgi:D-tyrosyl-tRNA(Tyr) deacylase
MRAVVQRVSRAHVEVGSETVGQIGHGFCVFVGLLQGDDKQDVEYMARKIASLRIFPDEQDRMNQSISDVAGKVLAVSQFTLAADTRKGNRPSFVGALAPQEAEPLFAAFCARLAEYVPVETGRFRTHMEVSLVNDGPVTILLDSRP